MPFVRPPKKIALVIVVGIFVATYGAKTLRMWGIIDSTGYAVVLGSGVLMVTLYAAWQGLQMAPKDFATHSEKSLTVNKPFEKVCEFTPRIIAKNHWKLQEADPERGHFKARIGMSLHTFSSALLVDVSRKDEQTSNVHVFCGTRSVNDPNHNDKMIAKFFDSLEETP